MQLLCGVLSPLHLFFRLYKKKFDKVLSNQNISKKELVRKGLKSDPKTLEKWMPQFPTDVNLTSYDFIQHF